VSVAGGASAEAARRPSNGRAAIPVIPQSKRKAGARTLRLMAEAKSILATRIANAPKSGWLFPGKKPGTHLVDVENAHNARLVGVINSIGHRRDTGAIADLERLRHGPDTEVTRAADAALARIRPPL